MLRQHKILNGTNVAAVYLAAKNKDLVFLEQVSSRRLINIVEHDYSAVKLAAELNDKDALELLLARGGNIHSAVEGSIKGKHSALTDELLSRGASKRAAISGYARFGEDNKALELLHAGVSGDDAMLGAGMGGNMALIHRLCILGEKTSSALLGAKLTNQTEISEQLIPSNEPATDWVSLFLHRINHDRHCSRYRSIFNVLNEKLDSEALISASDGFYAITSYVLMVNKGCAFAYKVYRTANPTGWDFLSICLNETKCEVSAIVGATLGNELELLNHLLRNYKGINSDSLLDFIAEIFPRPNSDIKLHRVLSFIENPQLREKILTRVDATPEHLANIGNKITNNNRVMSEYQLNYVQIKLIQNFQLLVFLLQVRFKNFPTEIMLHIASFIAESAAADVQKCADGFFYKHRNSTTLFKKNYYRDLSKAASDEPTDLLTMSF